MFDDDNIIDDFIANIPACTKCHAITGKKMNSCNRSDWPTVPLLPKYNEEDHGTYREYVTCVLEQNAAQQKAARVPVCKSMSQLCTPCARKTGCQKCASYECSSCAADEMTVTLFQEYDEMMDDPHEDCYGRRRKCLEQALNIHDCAMCSKSVCVSCNWVCSNCTKHLCYAHQRRHPWCEGCRFTIENNDDFDIGPIDREEYVCDSCWDCGSQCGYGEPSYDPLS